MSKNIKNKIGEKAAQYLERNFSADFLSENLPKIFGNLQDIREIPSLEWPNIKILLNKLDEEKGEIAPPKKTAKQMLDEAGFDLDDQIEKKSDYMKYSKFYGGKQKLCKFDAYDATERYSRIFWITRKGFENLTPFSEPKRQDEYGTSCMSIAISIDLKNIAQICNRYNHLVSGCDNTYNSNLDQIVVGLTEAFNADYGLSLKKSNSIEFENFYTHDQKYFHYFREINGIKIGKNVIDGVYFDPSQYIIFENYILDLKNKKIKNVLSSTDSFVDLISARLDRGDKVEIRKGEPPADFIEQKNVIYIFVCS
jgi:hypothetical protein